MDSFDFIKWFSFLAEVPILDVNSGSPVTKKELLKAIEETFDFLLSGPVHLSELFDENGVKLLSGVLAKREGGEGLTFCIFALILIMNFFDDGLLFHLFVID